jgi:hypothetical protein
MYKICTKYIKYLFVQELEVRFCPIAEAAQLSNRAHTSWRICGGRQASGTSRNGRIGPLHALDTATLGGTVCPWRAMCPAMQYMRTAIAQYLTISHVYSNCSIYRTVVLQYRKGNLRTPSTFPTLLTIKSLFLVVCIAFSALSS